MLIMCEESRNQHVQKKGEKMGLTVNVLSQNVCGFWLQSIFILSFHLNILGTDMKW